MWSKILGAVAPALLDKVGGQNQTSAAPSQGVQSITQSEAPAPVTAQPLGGVVKDGIGKLSKELVNAGIGSLVGPINAKSAGKANRKYLDSSFPELNPYEKAGVSATPAGSALAGQASNRAQQQEQFKQSKVLQDRNFQQQLKLQSNQLGLQEAMQAKQLDNQLDITAMNNAASIQSTRISSGPSYAKSESDIALNWANAVQKDLYAQNQSAQLEGTQQTNAIQRNKSVLNATSTYLEKVRNYPANADVWEKRYKQDLATILGSKITSTLDSVSGRDIVKGAKTLKQKLQKKPAPRFPAKGTSMQTSKAQARANNRQSVSGDVIE